MMKQSVKRGRNFGRRVRRGKRDGDVRPGLEKMWGGSAAGVIVLLVILFAGIGFRFYKAHYTGVIYDEVWTYEDYCKDVHTAVTSFKNVNNHVLNSVFIALTGKVLGGYEHFLRVPAAFFGALFCVAITYIVHKTIGSWLLKIVILMLILFNWFIVDLTYLGRGYACGLGASFAAIGVLMHLLSKEERGKVSWGVVVFVIVMNFLALGSMLSSLSIVLSINFAYALVMVLGAMKAGKKAVVKAIVGVVVILLGTGASLYLLFRDVYSDIVRLSKIAINMNTFFEYIKQVLFEPLIYFDWARIQFNLGVYKITLVVVCICAVVCLFAFIFRLKAEKGRYRFFFSPGVVVVLLSAGVAGLMFVQRVVFGTSLGMPRNGVFLLVLVLISVGILMDRAANALLRVKIVSYLLQLVCVVSVGVLCFLNLPSHRAVDIRPLDWGEQSSIGPLVRRLKQINPEKTWKIKLMKPHMESCNRPIRYYKRFGYKIRLVKGDVYDIWVTAEHRPNSNVYYFENERFADHHCSMVLSRAAFVDMRKGKANQL